MLFKYAETNPKDNDYLDEAKDITESIFTGDRGRRVLQPSEDAEVVSLAMPQGWQLGNVQVTKEAMLMYGCMVYRAHPILYEMPSSYRDIGAQEFLIRCNFDVVASMLARMKAVLTPKTSQKKKRRRRRGNY